MAGNDKRKRSLRKRDRDGGWHGLGYKQPRMEMSGLAFVYILLCPAGHTR